MQKILSHKLKYLPTIAVLLLVTLSCSQKEEEYQKPNIILILSDDMGFSDIGCYGGEIYTPNLNSLAENGIRFSQFYNTARCCPTRASLLTGLHPHQAGVGYMTRKLGDTKAYQGHLRSDRMTIAEIMKLGGYTTLHVGKWHVGNKEQNATPCERGFDRGWATGGAINFWDIGRVYEDGEYRETVESESLGII